jgi:hypothetical protein
LRPLLIYPEILATLREKDIDPRRAFGDDEGDRTRNEEKRKEG